jgi:hypothetical protein
MNQTINQSFRSHYLLWFLSFVRTLHYCTCDCARRVLRRVWPCVRSFCLTLLVADWWKDVYVFVRYEYFITYRQTVSARRVRTASAGHMKSRNPPDRNLFHQRNPLSRYPTLPHYPLDIRHSCNRTERERRKTTNER